MAALNLLNLTERKINDQVSMLHELREESGTYEAALIDADGAIVAFSSSDPDSLLPQMLSPSDIREMKCFNLSL